MTTSSTHLRFEGIGFSFATHRVLTNISGTIPAASRTGLIGENGSGKTTLLRILAGELAADTGEIYASARVGLASQLPPFAAEATVAEALADATRGTRKALGEVDRTAAELAAAASGPPSKLQQAGEAYEGALAEAERLDAWQLEATVAQTLAGLGIADLPPSRKTGEISGGQRSRLALACTLLSRPVILLLDEPTNHLDDSAIDYLTSVLANWSGPVLFASHDRAFLDTAATDLIDLDPSAQPHAAVSALADDGAGTGIGALTFHGRYSEYVLSRLDARERWEAQYAREQDELKQLRAKVRSSHQVGHPARPPRTEGKAAKKFYADRNAKVVSRRLNDAKIKLAQLEKNQIHKPPPLLSFRSLTPQAGPGKSRPANRNCDATEAASVLLAASNVSVTGRLSPTSISVSRGEKWLITGGNGAGKSTLLAVLAARLEPTSGSVNAPRSANVSMLGQEISPRLLNQASTTARAAYSQILGEAVAEKIPLSEFHLVAPRDETRALAELSTGQLRRLELAIALARRPQLLLLDEPTNHLSLVLATELEAALPTYPGAVIVASHDRWLRRNWQGRHLDLGERGMGRAAITS